MKILGVIPARYDSTRFPGKCLVDIQGKSMVRHVYERSVLAKSLTKVIVATDDQRIFDEIKNHNGNVVMTSTTHRNGTERCSEVLEKVEEEYDYIINIQGDEPFINPKQIEILASCLDGNTELGTLVRHETDMAVLDSPTEMKVVLNKNMEAMYFSRSVIPFVRDAKKSDWAKKHQFYLHVGIYAYRTDILKKIVKLSPGELEMTESLEQLRWLENGYKIKVALTTHESFMIDTPEDLEAALEHFSRKRAEVSN
ncbi:3-deoxy-manno-octulosonate cytidylyltransferase [Reichenbachiella sp. MALMAid0571]|uniref:3-deoxy-manno-octulosonate cytidylyltransferase n=1 Tax=Reichenbachiella sp. MALMAid0571 TaxID=3143939 RepID=UPI0032DE6E0F